MFRKSIVSGCLALLVLLTGLTGCSLTRELAGGVVKELKENEDGIRRELVELWNGFLDEVNDWAEAAARRSVTEDAALKGERRKAPTIIREAMKQTMSALPVKSIFSAGLS